jgi:hypothetical protein
MLKDRMFCSFMGNICPKFPRCSEIDGRFTDRSVCGILLRFLERVGILWGDISTHFAITLIHLLVTVSTPLDTVKSVKLKTSCSIAEHCPCYVIQIFNGLMVLKHAVLLSRGVVMSVFFRLNLHAHFRLSLQSPSPVLSHVIRLKKSLSNSLYARTVRLAGCGIISSV